MNTRVQPSNYVRRYLNSASQRKPNNRANTRIGWSARGGEQKFYRSRLVCGPKRNAGCIYYGPSTRLPRHPYTPSIHRAGGAEASSLKLAKPAWPGSPHGGIPARGTFPNVHCHPSRFPAAPPGARESPNCLSEFDNGSSRPCKIHEATPPAVTTKYLRGLHAPRYGLRPAVIAPRGCPPLPPAVRAAFDGSKLKTTLLHSVPIPTPRYLPLSANAGAG